MKRHGHDQIPLRWQKERGCLPGQDTDEIRFQPLGIPIFVAVNEIHEKRVGHRRGPGEFKMEPGVSTVFTVERIADGTGVGQSTTAAERRGHYAQLPLTFSANVAFGGVRVPAVASLTPSWVEQSQGTFDRGLGRRGYALAECTGDGEKGIEWISAHGRIERI